MTTEASVEIEALRSTVPNPDLWGAFRVKQVDGSRVELVGWVLGTGEDVRRIEVVSGGAIVATAAPNLARADVAREFPDRDAAANCGFEIAVEAQGKGQSSLRLQAVLAGGAIARIGEVQVTAPARRWANVFRRT
jgi:hypothetical protein